MEPKFQELTEKDPKIRIAAMIATGCKLTASENNNGTKIFPSNACTTK